MLPPFSRARSRRVLPGEALTPVRRFVLPFERRAEGDELEAIVARDWNPGRAGIHPDEATGPKLDLVAVDPHRPTAVDHEVDLLHALVSVVVLPALDTRRDREVVEAEGARSGRPARFPHHSAWPLTLERIDVDVGVAHGYILKMPNSLSGIGAFSAAEIPKARTRRVSSGSMIPSSQSRAVEWYGFPSASYLARISSGSASPTIVNTVAACSPAITEIRAFGHIQSWRGP